MFSRNVEVSNALNNHTKIRAHSDIDEIQEELLNHEILSELISVNKSLYLNNPSYAQRYSSPKKNKLSLSLIKEFLYIIENMVISNKYYKEIHELKAPKHTLLYSHDDFLQSILNYRSSNDEIKKTDISLQHKNNLLELRKHDISKLKQQIDVYEKQIQLLNKMDTEESQIQFEKDIEPFTNDLIAQYLNEKNTLH